MSTARIYTGVAKVVGLTGYAINQTLRAATAVSRTVADRVNNVRRYRIELLVDGATLKTKDDQSTRDIVRTIENMDDYGITGVIIHEQD
tara:strand:+ start:2928 stop:3194 length:267 start_codon:yes stop_codon:yes gene_type:complete